MSLNVLSRGSGPPMLLLHGFTGTARTWTEQIDTWSSEYRVIAPDLLGHGASDAPGDPAAYALERQADGLADLLELLDASPAIVVGYSMGARMALVLTLDHPARVERLVLESPSAGIIDDAERKQRRAADARLADALEQHGIEAFVDGWEAQPLFASQARLPDPSRRRLRAERLGNDPRSLAASLRGAGQGSMAPLHDRLSGLVVPTLVIAGSLDRAGRERAAEVAARTPGARLEVIAGAGHAPHLERPAEFSRCVTDFIEIIPATH